MNFVKQGEEQGRRMNRKAGRRTARHLAVLCLVSWDKEHLSVQPHIEALIYASSLNASDRQLALMLVQGVLRRLQSLDGIISRFARHPIEKMKPLTRMALRVGVYQLLYLERIPNSAAVNETVKVLKAERQPRWISNFVNAVLRGVSRSKADLLETRQKKGDNSVSLDHPEWLVKRWRKRYGPEKAELICHLNNREPLLVLLVNTLKIDRTELVELFAQEGIKARYGRYAPHALVIESPTGPVAAMPGFTEGYFHVQDEAAQLVTRLVGPFARGGRYLDACAGLGGKTCQLVQLIPEGSTLIAVEPSAQRFHLLQENLQRLGLRRRVECIHGQVGDLKENAVRLFNGILVDAPCSGTGVIGRHPDIRWNRNIMDLRRYQQQQLEILQQAADLLLPGGVLVYATCSMEPEENEQVIEAFLSRNRDFAASSAKEYLPGPASGLVDPEGFFATTPAEGLDGFFGARLVRDAK